MECKTVVVSIDELKDLMTDIVRQELSTIFDARVNVKVEQHRDEPLSGAKHIARAMGVGITTFYNRFREDMESKGYITYIGKSIRSTTDKVSEYMSTLQ